MRMPLVLLALASGCGGTPRTDRVVTRESARLDISADVPPDWIPVDVAGWRIFVPRNWEAHDFGDGSIRWSPAGSTEDFRFSITVTGFRSLNSFSEAKHSHTRKGRNGPETACVVHHEPCVMSSFGGDDGEGKHRGGPLRSVTKPSSV